MKTSINWLKNYVDVVCSPKELADRLTLAGLEVESVTGTGTIPDGVVIAEILSRQPHPNADRLSLCSVSVGTGEPLRIVCGAPNCDPGAKVPLATIGTVLGEGFEIKKSKIRGEVSFGMMCSQVELGLGEDKSGLMILPANAPVGAKLKDFLGSDTVIDWGVTPNRPDWLSHIGIAREMAAVFDSRKTFRLPDVKLTETAAAAVTDATSVEVRDPDLCPRYIARVIRNVKIGPSPEWMQKALSAVGFRPINNVVDITNYVLMECGQPLHAFDYERLGGHRIVVRRAAKGETMVTLDCKEHKLPENSLVIADADKGVALAGIMGGQNSEILDATSTVLLESAVFLPRNIRATCKALGIGTDSSYRFERGVDFEMTEFASRRAAALICELAGGELLQGKIDACVKPFQSGKVRCRFARANQLLGVDLSPETVVNYFRRLGLDILAHDAVTVEVGMPSFRLDIEREADLIEEVARIHGLDNIPPVPAVARVGGPMASDCFYPVQELRGEMRSLGLDETMTYSLIQKAVATAATGITEEQLVILSNPLSADADAFRPSVLPGVVQTLAHNIARNNTNLAFYEMARVAAHVPGLPEERHQVGIVLSGHPQPERFGSELAREYDFHDMKGLLESWFEARGIAAALTCRAADHASFRSSVTAGFYAGDTCVAVFGRLVDDLTRQIRLKHAVFAAVVEVEGLLAVRRPPKKFEALPQFPAVVRDISLVADRSLANQAIVDAVQAAKCPWLEAVKLFDIYEDDKALGAGRRSLAYSLTYRDRTRTLTDEEVNQAHDKVRSALAKGLPVELR